MDDDEYSIIIITDFFSKVSFVRKIPRHQNTSKVVIDLTKQIFSE